MARAKVFRPLAVELGWIIFEWNRLHEALAELFADLIDIDHEPLGFSIWYNTINERAQRDMLRAAVTTIRKHATGRKLTQLDEISWILGQLNELSGRRNNAIHSPLVFINDHHNESMEIMPHYFFGNPRATELRDKSLLGEFKWYRDHLSLLAGHAEDLNFAITFDSYSLPERPQLLPRGHYRTAAKPRQRSMSK